MTKCCSRISLRGGSASPHAPSVGMLKPVESRRIVAAPSCGRSARATSKHYGALSDDGIVGPSRGRTMAKSSLPLLHWKARKGTDEAEMTIGPAAATMVVGTLVVLLLALLVFFGQLNAKDALPLLRQLLLWVA